MIEINKNYMVDIENFKTSQYSNKNKSLRTRNLSDIEQVIIHCTAAGTKAWEDPHKCILYDLNPNHISRTGLATATYHFYLNQAGEVHQLVSMQIITAHAGNQNGNSVAVCINHNGTNKNEITEIMYSNLIETICYIFDKLDWGIDYYGVCKRIHFHRDYSPKLCPGQLDKQQVINDVTERLKTWGDNN